jgi:hypothetical protein
VIAAQCAWLEAKTAPAEFAAASATGASHAAPSRGVKKALRRGKSVHLHALLVVNHAHVNNHHDSDHEEAKVHPKRSEVGDVLGEAKKMG